MVYTHKDASSRVSEAVSFHQLLIFPLKEDKVRRPRFAQPVLKLPAVGIDTPEGGSNILSFQTLIPCHHLQDLLLGIKVLLAGILFKSLLCVFTAQNLCANPK